MTNCPSCGDPFPTTRKTGWCGRCVDRAERAREQRARAALGNRCACCQISFPLVWDHVRGDGGAVRRGRSSSQIRRTERAELTRIIRTGTSDRLQLLCPNCHYLKTFHPEEYRRRLESKVRSLHSAFGLSDEEVNAA